MISFLFFLFAATSDPAVLQKECAKQQSKLDKVVCSSPSLVELRHEKNTKYEQLYRLASKQEILQNSLQMQDQNYFLKTWKDCIAAREQNVSETEKDCVKKSYLENITVLDSLLKNGLLKPGYSISPISTELPQNASLSETEVLVVAGYSAIKELGYSKVQVDRPEKKVLIVLTSYDPVLWYLDVTPQTQVTGVILSSYKQSSLASRIPIPVYAKDLGYSYDLNDKDFVQFLLALNKLIGVSKLDQYVASYVIPEQVELNNISSAEELTLKWPKPINNDPSVSFDLISTDFQRVKWKLDGAGSAKNNMGYVSKGVVINTKTGEIYKLVYSEIEVADAHGKLIKTIPLPIEPNDSISSEDLAYDSKRKILSVYGWSLQRFDVEEGVWLPESKEPKLNLSRITYNEVQDEYVGLNCNGEKCILYFINPEGKLIERRPMEKGTLPDFDRLYSRNETIGRKLTIIAHGDNIIFIAKNSAKVLRIWNYNKKTKKAVLTYKAD